jgi:hypothetical protein
MTFKPASKKRRPWGRRRIKYSMLQRWWLDAKYGWGPHALTPAQAEAQRGPDFADNEDVRRWMARMDLTVEGFKSSAFFPKLAEKYPNLLDL